MRLLNHIPRLGLAHDTVTYPASFNNEHSGSCIRRQPRSTHRATSDRNAGQWACGMGLGPWSHSCEVRPIQKHSLRTTARQSCRTSVLPESSQMGSARHANRCHAAKESPKILPTWPEVRAWLPLLLHPTASCAKLSSLDSLTSAFHSCLRYGSTDPVAWSEEIGDGLTVEVVDFGNDSGRRQERHLNERPSPH